MYSNSHANTNNMFGKNEARGIKCFVIAEKGYKNKGIKVKPI